MFHSVQMEKGSCIGIRKKSTKKNHDVSSKRNNCAECIVSVVIVTVDAFEALTVLNPIEKVCKSKS